MNKAAEAYGSTTNLDMHTEHQMVQKKRLREEARARAKNDKENGSTAMGAAEKFQGEQRKPSY